MRNTSKNQRGFTLIELIFVIALLAILSMYGLSIVRNQARQEAINNTAVMLKSWLQAVLAYYADNNHWPTDFREVVGTYLPTSLVCSQFGGSSSGGLCQNGNSSFTGQNDDLFYTVSINVSDASTAKIIAEKLPASQVNGATVSASVPIPGARQGYITSAGIVSLDANNASISQKDRQIWLPPCEPGFEAHYLVTPQYYTTGFQYGEDKIDTYYNVISGISKLHSENGRYYVFANTTFADSTQGYVFNFVEGTKHYYAYYITYCIPGQVDTTASQWSSKVCQDYSFVGNIKPDCQAY